MKTKDGRLYVVSGASRSGKTAWVRQMVQGEARVFLWDPEAQWCELPGWTKATSRAQLTAHAASHGPRKVAYVVGSSLADNFDHFASCCMYAGRWVEPVAVVAEELADVTTTAKAPPAWGILVRRGLKRGINIYAISQRWSEADKTAFGNASDFVIFRASSMADVRYIAGRTKLEAEEISRLKPLEFVHLDAYTGNKKADVLTFGPVPARVTGRGENDRKTVKSQSQQGATLRTLKPEPKREK